MINLSLPSQFIPVIRVAGAFDSALFFPCLGVSEPAFVVGF
jgi:hypothetical protein